MSRDTKSNTVCTSPPSKTETTQLCAEATSILTTLLLGSEVRTTTALASAVALLITLAAGFVSQSIGVASVSHNAPCYTLRSSLPVSSAGSGVGDEVYS